MFRFLTAKFNALFRRISNDYRMEIHLNKIRTKNRTCRINKSTLLKVNLGKFVVIHEGAKLNNVTIGSYTYISKFSKLKNVSIGKYCSIGQNVIIGLPPHPIQNFVSTHPIFFSDKNDGFIHPFIKKKIFDDSIPETTIGNDVWISSNVVIPGKITIGDGAVIAAGSVVVKDVQPYSIVGGNPAKLIRLRFSKDQINQLSELKWWNWSEDDLLRHINKFANINDFLQVN